MPGGGIVVACFIHRLRREYELATHRVLEFDIRGLFDNIDHTLLMKAVRHHTSCKWVRLYAERWLRAGVAQENGELRPRVKGTPQGGVISPMYYISVIGARQQRQSPWRCPF